jgi:hypothetical protein
MSYDGLTTYLCPKYVYLISARGVMVSVLASNAVDRGFEPGSGQTKGPLLPSGFNMTTKPQNTYFFKQNRIVPD